MFCYQTVLCLLVAMAVTVVLYLVLGLRSNDTVEHAGRLDSHGSGTLAPAQGPEEILMGLLSTLAQLWLPSNKIRIHLSILPLSGAWVIQGLRATPIGKFDSALPLPRCFMQLKAISGR